MFGTTPLGDVRRNERLIRMTCGAARNPSGRVSVVFPRAREREGAYDFLENPHVSPKSVAESVFAATTRHAKQGERLFVAIDGSALSLSDENGAKGFGSVGSPNRDVRGLKVVSALAVNADGVPLGLVDQIFWNRGPIDIELTKTERTKRNEQRPFEEKEPAQLIAAAKNTIARLDKSGVNAWFVIDREADSRDILLNLHKLTRDTKHLFTVRGRGNRKTWQSTDLLSTTLDAEPVLGSYDINVPRKGKRPARVATVEVHATQVTLHFPKRPSVRDEEALRLFAVRIREKTKAGDPDGIEWFLYTNAPVLSAAHAREVIASYQTRWRIEEFHRTWKQGECNVEDSQLHAQDSVIIWATILGAVATRIERLKYLSRTTPDVAASVELAPEEIEALKLDQRRRMAPKRRKLPDTPTIAEATRWIADLGGWIGERNGPPGSIVLARGLERLGFLVEGIALARGKN